MDEEAKFSLAAFAWTRTLDAFENKLLEFGVDFERIDWDEYDHSLAIKEVPNSTRLSLEAQEFIFAQGFTVIYVSHCDGWQTHYHPPSTLKPWRRKIGPDGYMEINYIPKAWEPHAKRLIESGELTVVEDKATI